MLTHLYLSKKVKETSIKNVYINTFEGKKLNLGCFLDIQIFNVQLVL